MARVLPSIDEGNFAVEDDDAVMLYIANPHNARAPAQPVVYCQLSALAPVGHGFQSVVYIGIPSESVGQFYMDLIDAKHRGATDFLLHGGCVRVTLPCNVV